MGQREIWLNVGIKMCPLTIPLYLTVKIEKPIEDRQFYTIKCCQLETVSETLWSVFFQLIFL